LRKAFLLTTELGLNQLVPYAIYQLKLRSGWFTQATPAGGMKEKLAAPQIRDFRFPFPHLDRVQSVWAGVDAEGALAEAQLVLEGRFRPFGGEPSNLSFTLAETPLQHWTHYDSIFGGEDIKLTWEPARFTWVYPLIEAYTLTGNERYADACWQRCEEFIAANPVNLGPNWASAQEVALRVIPILFALKAFRFSPSSTGERIMSVTSLLFQSARRILPTLDYARSQNNNHLLSESLGLIMLGSYFIDQFPVARKWIKLGFKTFERGLETQLEPDGTYSQHSIVYHRMMLQLALVYCGYAQSNDRPFDEECRIRLCAATQWLAAQVDAETGDAPNLGHNDGTLLLPFGASCYRDFRPTLQAASLAFIGRPAYAAGRWDALPLWLGLPSPKCQPKASSCSSPSTAIHRVGNGECWGTLRAVAFHSRPAHADQLNVDLWWHGHNIALDAGTYMYNANPPWDNELARTCVHNTLTLNGQDQMARAGRFLWLDKVNAEVLSHLDPDRTAAQLTFHSRPRIRHRRTLAFNPTEGFEITDELIPVRATDKPFNADMQWLLPDWPFTLFDQGIQLDGVDYSIRLTIKTIPHEPGDQPPQISLIRAGVTLEGSLENPLRGWYSPTYNQKVPALSLVLRIAGSKKAMLVSSWNITTRTPNSG